MEAVEERTLPSILEERARRGDSRPFAFFSDALPLTAVAHLANASRIAAALAARGIEPGSRVILLGTTGPQLLGAIAGCWRLGALVCPAEAFLAPEGLRKIVEQFHPDLALLDNSLAAGKALAEICRDAGVPMLTMAEAYEKPEAFAGPHPAADDPALCIFTSGSTGIPKGVVLSHRNLIAGARNLIAAKGIDAADCVLCVLPMSHLNGLETTFVTPLVSGGSVVYLQGAFQPERALQLIDEHGCTWFSAVPTQYAFLLKPPVSRDRWSLNTLRFCRSASAPLAVRVRKEFEGYYGVPIIETMGMTETAGQIFCNPMPPEKPRDGAVGRPIGFDVRIVDEGRVCTAGQIGEIQVRSPAVMLGYLDNPEETARAFDGEWLRSGDLGSFDDDGFYYIRGRIKDIAIFSGVNISLRAIEAAVQEAGLVEDIACVGQPDYFFGETVIGYAIPRGESEDKPALADRVAHKLRGLLPSHQALKEVCIVERFPRNSAGKVLKGRLGEVAVIHSTRLDLSRDAKKLISTVLHIPECQIGDSIGLGKIKNWDSLGHVALFLAVEKLLGRKLTPVEINAITTLSGLRHVLNGTAIESVPHEDDEGNDHEKHDLLELMKWNNLLPSSAQGDPAVDDTGLGATEDVLTFAQLTNALRESGLGAGDTVLLHSDVGTLGLTEVGYDRDGVLQFYLDAFLDILGPDGTLCVCTSFEDYARYGTPFVREESPSRLGAFSEYVRTRPGAMRSMHPILSVTALGARADEIAGGDHFDGFGYESPWGRLHRLDAKQMTIGMGRYPTIGLTFVHYIEHLYGVPYQYTKLYDAPVFSRGKKMTGPFTMSVRYLDYSITYDSTRFRDHMLALGEAKRVAVGKDSILCTTSKKMIDCAVKCLSRDRYFFLNEAPRFRPGEIPMDGATGAMKYVYDRAARGANK